jgi:hypothetical protein
MKVFFLVALPAGATAVVCNGTSTALPQSQCEAWVDLFDSAGGDGWMRCALATGFPTSCAVYRTDPCGMTLAGAAAGTYSNVDCGSSKTTIQKIHLGSATTTVPWARGVYSQGKTTNMEGTLPDSVGDLVDLNVFTVAYSKLTGTVPATVGAWKKIVTFDVSSNELVGTLPQSMTAWDNIKTFRVSGNNFVGPLPTLPYVNMPVVGPTPAPWVQPPAQNCMLFDHTNTGTNSFTCPFPAGVNETCFKNTWDWLPVLDMDCAPPPTYSCDSGKGTCYLDAAGSQSQAGCAAACSEVTYSCNVATEQCTVDTAGKQSLAQCTASCVKPTPAPTPPPTYKCSNNQCVVAAGGIPKADCTQVCVGQLYQCKSCKCVPSSIGLSQATCQAACSRGLRGCGVESER